MDSSKLAMICLMLATVCSAKVFTRQARNDSVQRASTGKGDDRSSGRLRLHGRDAEIFQTRKQ